MAGRRFRTRVAGSKHLEQRLRLEIFFCDPHAPWQRGSNENTNGLLRQYFPHSTDFATVTEAQLDAVADEPNDRPRKRLGFAKPIEEISLLLLH
jgi:transposase, IS30 family